MKKRTAYLLVAAFLMCLVLPGVASATDVFHMKGTGAGAGWYTYNERTGVESGVYVDVIKGNMFAPDGNQTKGTFLFGNSYTYTPGKNPRDPGKFEDHWFLFEQIPDGDFAIARDLSSARLNTTVDQGSLSITWQGTGPLYKDSGKYRYRGPEGRFQSSWSGTRREGTASGTIFGNETGPSNYAGLYSSRSTDVIAPAL